MASTILKRGDPQSEKIKYIKGSFFVIRPDDTAKELFWIAHSLEDVPVKNKEVYVRWLTVTSDETEYKLSPETSNSKIPVDSIIITTILKSIAKSQDMYRISKTELRRVKDVVEEENQSSSDEEEEEEEEESESSSESEKEDKKKSNTTEKKKVNANELKKQKEKEKQKKLKEKEKEKEKKNKLKEAAKKKKDTSGKKKKSKQQESESEESSSSSSSSSESERESTSKKSKNQKSITKKKQTKKKQSESESESSSDSEKENKKKKPTKKATTKKSKKQESSSESESEDSSASESESDSDGGKSKKSKASIDKQKIKPLVKSTGKRKKDEDSDYQSSDDQKSTKKSRAKDGSAKKVKKEKPAKPAKPTKASLKAQTKKGNANPSIPEVSDPELEACKTRTQPSEFCCAVCTTREATRAVLVNNIPLLKEIIKQGRYHSLLCPWSVNVEYSTFDYAILNNNIEAIKLIYEDLKNNEKVRLSVSSFHRASTGSYSQYTYGHAVRALTQSRGGREGDEAFIHDSESYESYNLTLDNKMGSILNVALGNNCVKLSTIEELEKLDPNLLNYFELTSTFSAARSGNLEVTNHFVTKFFKRGGFGFNEIHNKVLDSEEKDLPPFKSVSATKKTTQGSVTPVHFASINPKGKYLKELVDSTSDFNKPDSNLYKPLHYAAACTSPVNIQFLVSKGVELNELNNQGFTPLMIASKLGRVLNIKALVKAGNDRAIINFVKTKNKKNQDALHIAAQEGQCGSIHALLEAGADVDVFEKGTKFTALMKAAAAGKYDAVKVLVEDGKADIEKKDKFKRTALVLAAINGHFNIVSYLLHFNASTKAIDSSKNTILHFTCAYGWDSITKYLVSTFSVPVNEFNDWKSTPLSISIRKGHFQTTKYLLDQNADANTCDENGTSILLQSLSSSISSSFISNLSYLVNQGKADIHHHDKDQNGALHILCFSVIESSIKRLTTQTDEEYQKLVLDEKLKIFTEVANLLVEKGININSKNKEGNTPLMLAFEKQNIPAIIFYLQKGASLVGTYSSSGSNILHNIINLQNSPHFTLITELILKSNDLSALVNQFNKQFLTPIMAYIKNYKSNVSNTQNIKFLRDLIAKSKPNLSLAETKLVETHSQNGAAHPNDADESMRTSDDDNSEEDDDDDENSGSDDDEDYSEEDDEDDYSNKNKTDKSKETPVLKRTALHFAVLTGSLEITSVLFEFNNKDIDPVTVNNETPLHMAIDNNHFTIATLLVDKGCNLKIANLFDRTPLHLACAKMNFPLIKKLTIKNSPVNKQDYKGLTPLMIACQNKHNISDDALEGEDNPISILLQNGADTKVVDSKKRNALHYSINASGSDTNSSFEIEDLLIKYNAPLNDQDYLGRTPLHYAFVKIGSKGIDNGTSCDPVQVVSSLASFETINIDLPDKFGRTPLFYACQHGSTVSALLLIQRKAQINRLDEDGNSPLAFSLFFRHPDCSISLIQKGADVKSNLHKYRVVITKKELPIELNKPDATIKPTKAEYTVEKVDKQTVGLFYHVISNNWQGAAYIMLDNGLDLFSSLRDAFKANKYQLALTLLSKCRNPAELKVTNDEKQNLFHFIGMYPSSVSNWATRIQAKLLSNGVSPNTKDSLDRTPLHYAAISKNVPFIQFLFEQKLDVNQRDKEGHTALSLSLLDVKEPAENTNFDHYKLPNEITTILLKKPNLNLTFNYQDNQITPLIYSIIINHSFLVKTLLDNKADINSPDGIGQPPLFYAVKANSMKIVEILLARKPNLNIKDSDKKSVIHCVVSPTEYGSYENVTLLKLLHSKGAEIDTQDIAGKTPNYYASLQESGKMKEALEQLGAKKIPANSLPTREISTIFNWNQTINYEEDYAKYIESKKEIMESTKKTLKPVVDPMSRMESNSEVYIDSESGLIYDVLMTKVDAGYGMYGENNFYKLQIIYNPQLDRYFVFNRWGRIGDHYSQYQKTPYNKEEAITEFCKLFKQKTNNVFSQATITNFQKFDGKYHLLAIDRTDRSKKEVLHPFNLSKYPESKLPKEIYNVMEQFCNVEAISNQLKSLKINSDIMPLGRLSKDIINKAIVILGKLNESIETIKAIKAKKNQQDEHNDDEDDDHKEKQVNDNLPPINDVLESQINLSNQFFELIPHADFSAEKMTVLRNEKDIASKIKLLQSLDEMETVSKILIAAHQNTSMHPYDYCFKAMGISMERLNESSPEFEILKKYSTNTGCHQKIHNIYKIQRKGEAEKIQQHKSLKNHYLLWHGSLTTNYLSILSQGLKIAPPEAPATGYMFGKGVYFSDMFQKSINYCNAWGMGGNSVSNHSFLLLSEVALGTMAEFKQANYMESPQSGSNSTKGVGKNSPNFDNSIILNNGVCIPLSKPEYVKDPTGYTLEMNEYIVYNTSQIRMRYLVEVSKN